MTAKKLADGLVRVRTKLPLQLYWRDGYVRASGQWVDVDHCWMTAKRWERSGLAADPDWRARTIGPFVVGYRVAESAG